MAIRMTGLTSGLDTESIVASLMEAHKAKKHKVDSKKQKLEWKQEAWEKLNTKIYNFYKDYAGKMRFQTNYKTKKATSSDSTKVTATAGSNATKGTYRVNVKQLAAAQYVTSAKVPEYTTTNEDGDTVTKKVSGSTKLSEIGMVTDGSSQIQVSTEKKTLTFNVDEHTTVSDFLTLMQDAGLNATFDSSQGRFFIGAKGSGANQKFTIQTATLNADQLTAQQQLKNVLKYNDLSSAQKKSVQTVMSNIQNGTNADKLDKSITTLQGIVDSTAKSEVTKYFTNEIKDNYISQYVEPHASGIAGMEQLTAAGREALKKAGKIKDGQTYKEEDLVKMAKQLAQTNASKDIKSQANQDKIKDALENGFDDGNGFVIASKDDRHQAVEDAVNDYATEISNGVTVQAGSSAELKKLGLDTIDGSEVKEDASGNSMVVVAAADSIVQVNGATLTSTGTTMDIGGLTINLAGETDGEISITVADDVESVYDSIKEFINQYNSILSEMNKLYNADSSRGYDVLTEEQKDEMSDDEVEKWNAKIKDSLLRRDSTLDGVISTMRSITGVAVTASNGKKYSLANLGITMGKDYKEHGLLHIKGDEDDTDYADSENTLMNLLKQDPDIVSEVMAGLTSQLYNTLTKKMQSSKLSSALTFYNDKEMKKQISQYNKDIKKWETKLKDYEDRYYKQFTAMEKALSSLSSQQSALSGYFGA